MKIAVTGAGSFIGSALHACCHTQGIEWVGVDVAPPGPRHSISADISRPGWDERLPPDVDAIVHLAAISRDADCRRDPARAVEVNLAGTVRVVEAARRRAIRQIVFASSEWVYGDTSNTLKNEDAVIDAASLSGEYAITKLAGERLLAMAAREAGLAVSVLRFGIVYGPRAANWSAVETLYDSVGRLDRIEVGSLDTARRFIHVDDIGRGILAAVGRSGYEVFNLTGDRLVTLGEVIEESVRLRGRAPVVIEKNPGSASIRNIDNARARAALRWRPEVDLRHGLESLS